MGSGPLGAIWAGLPRALHSHAAVGAGRPTISDTCNQTCVTSGLSARRMLTASAGSGLQGWAGRVRRAIAEPERAEEGGGWSAAPPGRCPENEEVGRVRTLYHIPGTGLVHR